jgi:hypothetical protein
MSSRWLIVIAATALLVESVLAGPAHADGGEALLERLLDDGRSTAATSTTTGAPAAAVRTTRTAPRDAIRLTPDRTEIVRLDQDAASVVVTNPAHAQVMMETPRLLLVMPRTPGSTSLFVLNADGETILERDIIVGANAAPYVRIRKSCNAGDGACAADAYYYCPDGCYEVGTVAPAEGGQVPEIPGGSANIDALGMQGQIPPNARSRTEPPPLPVMDTETGLSTDESIDLPTDSQEQ